MCYSSTNNRILKEKTYSIKQVKNTVTIDSDGINVYVNATVKINPVIKILISILAVIVFALFMTLVTHIRHNDVKAFIIPLLIMSFLLIYFVARPVMWNLFGQEVLIINTKSISYCYEYGIIRTRLKTIKFHRLGIGYEKVRYFDQIEYGKLCFVDYNEDDNLPSQIHETTVLLPHGKIKEIDNKISDIFNREYFERMNFIPYSLN